MWTCKATGRPQGLDELLGRRCLRLVICYSARAEIWDTGDRYWVDWAFKIHCWVIHTVHTDVYPTNRSSPQPDRAANRIRPFALLVFNTSAVFSVLASCVYVYRKPARACGPGNRQLQQPLHYQAIIQQPPMSYLLLSSLYISSNANSSSLCHSSFISKRLYAGRKSWGGICATICLLRIRSIFCICSSSFSSLSLSLKYKEGMTNI